ncbi:MAG: lamin tail domain-containing protein [Blastocatellia bacterium]
MCVLIIVAWRFFDPSNANQHAANIGPEIVISQIFGGGGGNPNGFKNDFVELFNRGSVTTSLVGWSLQYTPANSGAWQMVELSGSIAPGQYYLIQLSPGAIGSKSLPAPDAVGSVGVDASAGKVALVKNNLPLENAPNSLCPSAQSQIVIVDFVAYGSLATCFRGSAPAPSAGSASATIRRGEGCTDTRSNVIDFVAAPPIPRNSASPLKPCSGVTQPQADVIVTTQTGAAVAPRGIVSFLISVMNSGPAEATNVVVTAAFPAGFTELGGGQIVGNSIAFVPIDPLAAGGRAEFTVTARAPETAGKYFIRSAANTDTFDPNTSNNTSLRKVRVAAGAMFEEPDTFVTIASDGQCSSSYTVETVLKNTGLTDQRNNTGAEFIANLSPGIVVSDGSCFATKGQCRTSALPGSSTVQWDGDVQVGEEVTITYTVQVLDTKKAIVEFCVEETVSFDSDNDNRNDATALFRACDSYNSTCDTNPPTEPTMPSSSAVSSQKPGSILFFNLYSSSATDSITENTRINITNIADKDVTLHQFFVEANTCSVSDNFQCLTGNQTSSFMVSDVDPDVTGYLIVVAVDTATGCPINFNYLIGDEYVSLTSGHTANLGAEAFAAISNPPCACDENTVSVDLLFDGMKYNQAPRVLLANNLPSFADSNSTLIVLNRINGNLLEQVDVIGDFSGLLFDDLEHGLSFTASGGCQFRQTISTTFPRVTPRFPQFVPSGHTGWMKIIAREGVAILGSMIVLNTEKISFANAFNGGHNLHRSSFAPMATYKLPVFPPPCYSFQENVFPR